MTIDVWFAVAVIAAGFAYYWRSQLKDAKACLKRLESPVGIVLQVGAQTARSKLILKRRELTGVEAVVALVCREFGVTADTVRGIVVDGLMLGDLESVENGCFDNLIVSISAADLERLRSAQLRMIDRREIQDAA